MICFFAQIFISHSILQILACLQQITHGRLQHRISSFQFQQWTSLCMTEFVEDIVFSLEILVLE